MKKFNSFSLTSKYPILLSFYSNLNKFSNLNPTKRKHKIEKATVFDNASELLNEYLEIFLMRTKLF